MFRRIGFGAAAVLTAGVLAIGCSDDSGGDTIIGGSSFATDAFPGSTIAASNVADDGKAFTNQGQNVSQKFQIYHNTNNNTAIAVYETQASVGSGFLLYAAYYNGTAWAAPVQIRGRHLTATPQVFADETQPVGGFKVLWLNTAGNSVAEVAARDGDAIILFTQLDSTRAPGATSEDPNVRLWITYFDKSAATAAASGTVVRGFNTEAATVDDDLIITNTGVGGVPLAGESDPPVNSFGFVSDSLECTHEFTNAIDPVDSGNTTTLVNIVYDKQESSTVGNRYHVQPINLDAADNDLDNLLAGEQTVSIATASVNGDSVDSGFYANDEYMFYQANITDNLVVDEPIVVVEFDADGEVDSAELGTPVIASNDTPDSHGDLEAENIYGRDHGLAALYAVFTETGFDQTGLAQATSDRDDDTDVMVAQIDYDDAGASVVVQNVKIDPYADTIDTTAGATNRIGTNTGATLEGTAMNRTGDFIAILMQETSTDVTDAATVTNFNQLAYIAAVHTRRSTTLGAASPRALANSVTDATAGANIEPHRVQSAVASGTAASGIQNDVTAIDFQDDYAGGQADSQDGDCHLGCVFQSDSTQMNFSFEQTRSTGTPTLTDLFWNGVEVTVDNVDETVAPTLAFVANSGASSTVVATKDAAYPFPFAATLVDAGDTSRDTTGAPTTESGRPLIFFLNDRDNPTNRTATNNVDDIGLFAWEDGDTELVSTDGPREYNQIQFIAIPPFGFLYEVVTVAVNENITQSPHHSGTRVHVIWAEQRDSGPGQRIMTRSYEKTQLQDTDTTNDGLDLRFVPDTGTDDPIAIDLPTDGDLFITQGAVAGGEFASLGRSGSTVGFYFAEDQHIYYTDTSTDATGWDAEGGLPAPQLVDNDDQFGQRVVGWRVYARPECDNLPGGQVVFTRADPSQFGIGAINGAFRTWVRIHN